MFSPGFCKWIHSKEQGQSIGNGAMMRIAPIGWFCNSLQEVEKNAIDATIPSHNSEEAITNAGLIAKIIYLARNGKTKNEIIEMLNLNFTLPKITKFNYTCADTINVCLYSLLMTDSFEDSIKKVISFGGDTDTNACIVGSMAEALYGIDEDLINSAKN